MRIGNDSPHAQSGAALIEYCIASVIVLTVLFIPLPGVSESLVSITLAALQQFQQHSALLIALP